MGNFYKVYFNVLILLFKKIRILLSLDFFLYKVLVSKIKCLLYVFLFVRNYRGFGMWCSDIYSYFYRLKGLKNLTYGIRIYCVWLFKTVFKFIVFRFGLVYGWFF